MGNAWDNLGRLFRDGLRAIAPHGPGGVIAVLLALVGVGGLVLKANEIATVLVVAISYIAYAFFDERDYRRRTGEQVGELTRKRNTQVAASRDRLTRRLEARRAGDEPLLFDEGGADREPR